MTEKKQEKKFNRQSVLYIIFSVFCAFLLWIYVTETEGQDIDRTFTGVRVVFEGESTMRESRGLIISDTSNTSVRLTLTGNRRTLSNLNAADLAVVIDLSGISKTGNYSLAPRVTYPSRTDSSAITQTSVSPSTINFYVDKLSTKTVNIVGVFNGNAADGYSAEPMEFEPNTVKISGPENVLATVDHAVVQVDREDVDKTLSFDSTYMLVDQEGKVIDSDEITFDSDTVHVTLPINYVKEVALVVDLVPGGGATENNVKWKLEPSSITLSGDAATLAGVNSISVAKIDLSQVNEALTESYKIVIPNDTEITSGETEATLTLELGGLHKKVVNIDKNYISCTNVSEGFSAQIMNDSINNVILRSADSRALNSVSDVNIRAVADLGDYGTATGIVSVPVKIYVDGTTEVGAVGEYSVYVNIVKGS